MGRGVRGLRIWAVTTLSLAVCGLPLGLLWAAWAPPVRYVLLEDSVVLADPETQALIATDGRFAVIAAAAGLLSGALAYLAGGRDNDVPLVLGLGSGGLAGALLAWWAGHQTGPDDLGAALRAAAGRAVEGPADLQATGVVVFWPLLAVAMYGFLEVVFGRLAPRYAGHGGVDEPYQIPGVQFHLQAAPAGRDEDRGKP
ncbi:hypothetical protein [Thermomonospora catenispora]|uniref:hypothetical protein n=1 Tax=Thermomonospora catenispora TaxID=2493090 RepID=UPI001F503B3A|nr:hypothetical protein [Thermomonospora catenispora]